MKSKGGFILDINFYYVTQDYIDFLKDFEIKNRNFSCVPNTQYTLHKKFLYGAVFNKDGIDYFVPISSKIKTAQNNIIIKIGKNNKTKSAVGSLRFQYMIPVPRKCLIKIDINKDISEYDRKQLMRAELAFCRKNIDKIKKQAQKTYYSIINTKNEHLINNSCDFKLLEKAYILYCGENNIDLPEELQALSY